MVNLGHRSGRMAPREVIIMLELQDSLDAAVTDRITRREREATDWRLVRASRRSPPAPPLAGRVAWLPRQSLKLHPRHPC
jgi:hypothetical protein